MSSDWRGNVRELQNAAERHAIGLDGEDSGDAHTTFSQRIDAFERSVLEQALRDAGGSVKAAHEALGMARKTFYEKMKKHRLSRAEFVDD